MSLFLLGPLARDGPTPTFRNLFPPEPHAGPAATKVLAQEKHSPATERMKKRTLSKVNYRSSLVSTTWRR